MKYPALAVQGHSMLANHKVQTTYEGKTEKNSKKYSFDHVVNSFMKK